ncbi:efflux RND transporter periplasmic adaptor subunit [Shewanella algae]
MSSVFAALMTVFARKGSNASLFSMPLLIVSGFLLLGCDPEPVAITPKLVVVEEVKQATVPVYGNYVGITKASLDVEVRARVDGFVEERLFTEGSAVNAGDILYKIDNRPYNAVVNRLKANVESQQAILEKAQRDVKRLKPLYEQDAASLSRMPPVSWIMIMPYLRWRRPSRPWPPATPSWKRRCWNSVIPR